MEHIKQLLDSGLNVTIIKRQGFYFVECRRWLTRIGSWVLEIEAEGDTVDEALRSAVMQKEASDDANKAHGA